MKRSNITKMLLGTMFSLLLFSGCSKENETVNPIETVSVKITLPEDYTETSVEGIEISMTGVRTTYTATTDETGVAVFKNIHPDYYTISGSKEITASLLLSGQLVNYSVLTESDATNIALNFLEVKKTSFVISKIYVAGVKDDNNKNYTNDVYIEFFNNSSEDVVLDNTYYFALTEAVSTPAFPAKDSTDYVFARQVFRFISDSSTKTVKAGDAILVANSAFDHTKNAASSSVDLSVADFEAKDLNGKVANNDSIAAIEQIHTAFSSISNMNLSNTLENGVVLFRTTEDVKQWPSYEAPGSSNQQFYMRIPITSVLDGIEVLRSNVTAETIEAKKRLSKRVDQGFAALTTLTGLNGDVIARKVKSTSGSVATLEDTNNSSNDCVTSNEIKPKAYNY